MSVSTVENVYFQLQNTRQISIYIQKDMVFYLYFCISGNSAINSIKNKKKKKNILSCKVKNMTHHYQRKKNNLTILYDFPKENTDRILGYQYYYHHRCYSHNVLAAIWRACERRDRLMPFIRELAHWSSNSFIQILISACCIDFFLWQSTFWLLHLSKR